MVDLPFNLIKFEAFAWHKWIGLTVLLLTLARIAWRWYAPPPPLPETVTAWERRLAPSPMAPCSSCCWPSQSAVGS